jgi:hypothetical protein
MLNWEWRAEATTGGEDGKCDLEDELDYCGCCFCSIWVFTGDVCRKEVIMMLKWCFCFIYVDEE